MSSATAESSSPLYLPLKFRRKSFPVSKRANVINSNIAESSYRNSAICSSPTPSSSPPSTSFASSSPPAQLFAFHAVSPPDIAIYNPEDSHEDVSSWNRYHDQQTSAKRLPSPYPVIPLLNKYSPYQRNDRDFAPGSYDPPHSERWTEESELLPEVLTDADEDLGEDDSDGTDFRVRETYFVLSAERGRWRSSPIPIRRSAKETSASSAPHASRIQSPPRSATYETNEVSSIFAQFRGDSRGLSSTPYPSDSATHVSSFDINRDEDEEDEHEPRFSSPLPPSSVPASPMSLASHPANEIEEDITLDEEDPISNSCFSYVPQRENVMHDSHSLADEVDHGRTHSPPSTKHDHLSDSRELPPVLPILHSDFNKILNPPDAVLLRHSSGLILSAELGQEEVKMLSTQDDTDDPPSVDLGNSLPEGAIVDAHIETESSTTGATKNLVAIKTSVRNSFGPKDEVDDESHIKLEDTSLTDLEQLQPQATEVLSIACPMLIVDNATPISPDSEVSRKISKTPEVAGEPEDQPPVVKRAERRTKKSRSASVFRSRGKSKSSPEFDVVEPVRKKCRLSEETEAESHEDFSTERGKENCKSKSRSRSRSRGRKSVKETTGGKSGDRARSRSQSISSDDEPEALTSHLARICDAATPPPVLPAARSVSPTAPSSRDATQALHAEITGMLIESLAASRSSSMAPSSLYITITQCHPTLKEQRSKKEWIAMFSVILEEAQGRCGMFGKVESSGKDDRGRPLEARWFYIPERDEDQERAELIKCMMPRAGKRSETKKYKQYYWRPLERISRWDPEDEM